MPAQPGCVPPHERGFPCQFARRQHLLSALQETAGSRGVPTIIGRSAHHLRGVRRQRTDGGRHRPAVTREHEVSELVAQGCTSRQIARLLHVKENTVEVHVGRILRKLRVGSRTAVARIVTLSKTSA